MNLITKVGDFTGKYELHKGAYVQTKLQAYIDKYEPRYLKELFGVTLYNDFYSDLVLVNGNYVPQSPNFTFLFEPFAEDTTLYRMLISDGIKEMLLGYIYFEYAKDLYSQQTVYGAVNQLPELSNPTSTLSSLMYTRYNESVRTMNAIRNWIMLHYNDMPLGQAIDGEITITASGTGYTTTGFANAFPVSGRVLTASVNAVGTGYATNNGVPVLGGSGTGMLVDYVDDGSGGVASITIVDGGTGYVVGDVVTIDDGNDDATLDIDTATPIINGSGLKVAYVANGIGEIMTTTAGAIGTGYTTSTQVPTTGGSGNGCLVNIQDDGSGGVLSYTIADGGSGYTVTDVLTIDAGNQDADFIVASVQNGEVILIQVQITNKGEGYNIGDVFALPNDGDGTCLYELDYVGIGDITKYNGKSKSMAYWL